MSVNPRSLENLKRPKRRKRYGLGYQVPQDKIDEMFKLITEGISIKEAARKIDICYATAKKYFDKGDDKRGIKPLKLRLQIFQDTVSREFDVKLVERRKHLLDIVVKAISQIEEAIDANVLTKKTTYSQLTSLIRLEMFLRGGTIERHEEKYLTAEGVRELSEKAE